MNRSTTWLIAVLVTASSASCFATLIQWPTLSGGNGHYYDVKLVGFPIKWDDARLAAASQSYEGFSGNLATMTSQAENDFVVAKFGDLIRGVWLGGFQPEGSPEPAGGWQWITGEPFSYTNWEATEPNNSGGHENNMTFATAGSAALGVWNDLDGVNPPSGFVDGYVVEIVPEPGTLALAVFGFIGLVALRLRKRKPRFAQ